MWFNNVSNFFLLTSHLAEFFWLVNFDHPHSLPMYESWTIDGKNLRESIVRMEMVLPHAVVSNGLEGGGGF